MHRLARIALTPGPGAGLVPAGIRALCTATPVVEAKRKPGRGWVGPFHYEKKSVAPPSETDSDGGMAEDTAHAPPHTPVMVREVVEAFSVASACMPPSSKPALFVDATFGAGGHSAAILAALPEARVLGIDRDRASLAAYGEGLQAAHPGRVLLHHGEFKSIYDVLTSPDYAGYNVRGVLLDLGVSSMQIDQSDRGFSYRDNANGSLDMRMDQSQTDILTAGEFLNSATERDIADVIFMFGEERFSRRIAKHIALARKVKRLETTDELVHLVTHSVPWTTQRQVRDCVARTFQAIRIHINDELGNLQAGLVGAGRALGTMGGGGGAVLVTISYHSLEDSMAKDFMYWRCGRRPESKVFDSDPDTHTGLPTMTFKAPLETAHAPGRRALKPMDDEVAANSRARSARLRAAYTV